MSHKRLAWTIAIRVLAPATALLTSCNTTNPTHIQVLSTLDEHPPFTKQLNYSIVFSNELSRELVQPEIKSLVEAFEELGYVPSSQDEAEVIVFILAAIDQLESRNRPATSRDTGERLNPDSIRHKNVAAMLGGGRYPELLNDNPNAPGDVVIGPQGELIETGSLRKRSDLNNTSMVSATVRVNTLIISAVRLPPSHAEPPPETIWQVHVSSSVPTHKKSAEIEELVSTAVVRIAEAGSGK